MKTIIEFNLPEDSIEHEIYTQAPKMLAAIQEFCDQMRTMIKYEGYQKIKLDDNPKVEIEKNKELVDSVKYQVVEHLRTTFYEVLNDNNVKIDL